MVGPEFLVLVMKVRILPPHPKEKHMNSFEKEFEDNYALLPPPNKLLEELLRLANEKSENEELNSNDLGKAIKNLQQQ